MPRSGHLAVTLGGIEPATFEHCALIREWLADLGVHRATLIVAEHDERCPALDRWLRERSDAGDAVVRAGLPGPDRPITGFDWWLTPGLWRAGAALHRGDTLRVDLHPAVFDGRLGRTRALERTLRVEADRRRPVTCLQLDRRLPGEAARVTRFS